MNYKNQYCRCEFPVIRTSVNKQNEYYCSLCQKDIRNTPETLTREEMIKHITENVAYLVDVKDKDIIHTYTKIFVTIAEEYAQTHNLEQERLKAEENLVTVQMSHDKYKQYMKKMG